MRSWPKPAIREQEREIGERKTSSREGAKTRRFLVRGVTAPPAASKSDPGRSRVLSIISTCGDVPVICTAALLLGCKCGWRLSDSPAFSDFLDFGDQLGPRFKTVQLRVGRVGAKQQPGQALLFSDTRTRGKRAGLAPGNEAGWLAGPDGPEKDHRSAACGV